MCVGFSGKSREAEPAHGDGELPWRPWLSGIRSAARCRANPLSREVANSEEVELTSA